LAAAAAASNLALRSSFLGAAAIVSSSVGVSPRSGFVLL
jgi:hypothetical protein